MRALIFGASGQLGKRLAAAFAIRGVPYVGTARKRVSSSLIPVDITDRTAVAASLKSIQPTAVFLCSALTAVDYCETHPQEARAINVEGVRNVADACKAIGAKLVFLSTDYVFDGRNGPYSENDATSPESVYGKTKLEGERIVLELPQSIVARTSVVYDWDSDSVNFAMQMIARLGKGQPTNVVSDQWNHPTLTRNLAESLIELVDKHAAGVFHIVGPDYVSRFDFAATLATTFGFDPTLLTKTTTESLKQAAPRPMYCDLKTENARRLIAPLVGIEQGLALVHQDYAAGGL
jgi:dTDP-4-dehydrorhamnose reductase